MFDELKYQETLELVRSIKLEDTGFNLFGIEYLLRICPSKNYDGSQNGEAAEYVSRETVEWVIYLWGDDIEEKIQRPLLFHEIVEVYHRVEGMHKTPAHNITLPLEKRFCEEYLTKSELENHLKFKKKYGYNGFELSSANP